MASSLLFHGSVRFGYTPETFRFLTIPPLRFSAPPLRALGKARPQIANTDQGTQLACAPWIGTLESAGAAITMDGRGRASDNIFVERPWRSVKREEACLHDHRDPAQAWRGAGSLLRLLQP